MRQLQLPGSSSSLLKEHRVDIFPTNSRGFLNPAATPSLHFLSLVMGLGVPGDSAKEMLMGQEVSDTWF